MKKIINRFYDSNSRIEKMFLLAGVLADESMPQDVEDFFTDEDFKTYKEIFGKIPGYVKDDMDDGGSSALPAWLLDTGKLGFLVQFATPIMKQCGKGATFSWGCYYTKWVYGNTLDEALKSGFKWVQEQREKEGVKVG